MGTPVSYLRSDLGPTSVSSLQSTVVDSYSPSFGRTDDYAESSAGLLDQDFQITPFSSVEDSYTFVQSETDQYYGESVDSILVELLFYAKSMRITGSGLMDENTPLPEFSDFILELSRNIGSSFEFSYTAFERTSLCVVSELEQSGSCIGTFVGSDGVRLAGSATLTGISNVPVPPTLVLFVSALVGLFQVKRFRR